MGETKPERRMLEDRRKDPDKNRAFWLLLFIAAIGIVNAWQSSAVRAELGSRATARQEMEAQLQVLSELTRKANQDRWDAILTRFDGLESKLDAHLKTVR